MTNPCETSEQAAATGPLDQPLDERLYNIVNVSALAREHSAIEENLRTVVRLATATLPIPRNVPDYAVLAQQLLDAHDALDRASAHVITCVALTQKSHGEA